MRKLFGLGIFLIASVVSGASQTATPPSTEVMKVGIVGLVHGHVESFLGGGNLNPAGSILKRPDTELVGVVEPDGALFDKYAQKYHLSPSLHFKSIAEMVSHAHPKAVLVFTPPSQHRRIVEESAALGVHVLMEKPLAFTYADALAMQGAAEKGHIHVLVDYETAWYTSNTEAVNLLQKGALGPIVKAVMRDGHEGPAKIHVQPEFLSWLIDPAQDGDGALTDFGCYGPNLMTWMMHGEAPISVTAVTKRLQPELYPKVSDEAEILLNYPHATAIVEGSWNWPFAVKQMDVYGATGYAKTIDSDRLDVRKRGDASPMSIHGAPLVAPYDDPLHYMEAVISGQIEEKADLSSLKNNVIVAEILDAARRSAESGKTVKLPLDK
ncbi:Gfo/Idh/MocA family protein [Granulicella aggregans]|uniref:Gfo/Idh/MocA family protein n=1 Tax=Granulicella aggregans TaxID=474949 RepID=UPI0021DF8C0E|nr:Gfo/Idh/MocA family oxidoreductase [Granulicella aggregans]